MLMRMVFVAWVLALIAGLLLVVDDLRPLQILAIGLIAVLLVFAAWRVGGEIGDRMTKHLNIDRW